MRITQATRTSSPPTERVSMKVTKRNGATEPVDVNKIVRAVERCAAELPDVDPLRIATKTISGLYDGATTEELDKLSIRTASELIGEEPSYSLLAARLLSHLIGKEVRNQGVHSFSQSVALGYNLGQISDITAEFVEAPSSSDSTRCRDPQYFNDELAADVKAMMLEAVDAEYHFALDLLSGGVAGMTTLEMRCYVGFVADQRMTQLELEPIFGTKNPFAFMELQDVQELSNFFERRVSAYQVGATGTISFDESF